MKRQTEDFIKLFLDFLHKNYGYSKNTIRAYESDLTLFTNYLKHHNIDNPLDKAVSPLILRRFVALESAKGVDAKTLARRTAALRSFYRWAKRQGFIDVNPASSLYSPKMPIRIPSFLTEREVQVLLDEFKPQSPKEERDLILFKTIYGLGLRISEALNIKMSSLDLESNTIRIVGKGNKERILPIPKKLSEELKVYISDIWPTLSNSPSEYLFISSSGKKLSDTSARKRLRLLLLKAGITTKTTPHTLRHSIATHLLARGVDIRIVQEILGHATLNTTQIYTHTDKSWLQNIYRKTHPKA